MKRNNLIYSHLLLKNEDNRLKRLYTAIIHYHCLIMDRHFREDSRGEFYSYDSGWVRTYYDEKTGGFVVTELARKYKPMSKNERDIFNKEQRMAVKYASFGFQIEHLNENPGISSPDIRLRRIIRSINVNGITADFKCLSSSNKIYIEGKEVKFKKKADLVLFEFTSHFQGITRKIEKLVNKGIHGYYYYTDENECFQF